MMSLAGEDEAKAALRHSLAVCVPKVDAVDRSMQAVSPSNVTRDASCTLHMPT